MGKYPAMQATDLVERIKKAKGGSPVCEKEKTIQGKLDLEHLSLDVALIVEDCEFEDPVDLRYCEFKQVVKFRNCDFKDVFNSGDDTDSQTIYRKNLVCNDSNFCSAARFRGLRCEGHALFRGAKFCLEEPLEDVVHGKNLQRPPTDFTGASFDDGIDCEGAKFWGAVSFNLADCGLASFKEATFLRSSPLEDRTKNDPEANRGGGRKPAKILLERPPADFTAAKFTSLDCEGAEFKGAVSFRGVECVARSSFQDARFEQQDLLRDKIGTLPDEIGGAAPVDFTGASFGYLNALGADFEGAASFNSLKCVGDAVFKNARFLRPKWEVLKKHNEDLRKVEEELEELLPSCPEKYRQVRSKYERHRNDLNVDFKYSEFRSGLFLQGAGFARPVTLKRVRISDTLNLNGATFGDTVSFYGTKIGRLRFRRPWFRYESADLRECTFESLAGLELEDCLPKARGRLGRVLVTARDQLVWLLKKVGLHKPAKWLEGGVGADEVLNTIMDKKKFSMQPYLQLEKWYLLGGDENKAREIYRKGRRRARKNAGWIWLPGYQAHVGVTTPESHRDQWPWLRKISDLVLDYLTGYGVRIGRLLIIVLIFVCLGAILFEPYSTMKAIDHPSPLGDLDEASRTQELVERFTYSVDLFVPLVKLGVDDIWVPKGWWPHTYAFLHMLVGWLVVPLLLASLAGIIRKR